MNYSRGFLPFSLVFFITGIVLQSATHSALCQSVPFRYVVIDANNPRHPHTATVGDIDGDGFVDVTNASADGFTDGLYWYRYPAWTKARVDTGSFPGDMQNGDIDGDGDIDLVALRGIDSGISLWWYENPRPLGNPATAPWTRRLIDVLPSHDVELADLNADGKLDIIIRRDTLVVFFQGTGLTWQKVTISNRPKDGTGIGDIDRDGDLDIAINGYWYRNPLPLDNPVNTTWTEHFVVAGWPVQVGVRVEDVNGNGRNDIVLSPSAGFSGRLSWYEAANPITGPWTEHVIDPTTDAIHTFKAADFDRDGDLDIITGEGHWGNDPDYIYLHLNQGGGLSWNHQLIATTGIHNLRIADIGSDGDIDIVGSNSHDIVNPHGSPLEMWQNLQFEGTPVPVQLASFTARMLNENEVRLDWMTVSETNNFGFFVQRSINGLAGNWRELPNSFIAGHGTTLEPHFYSFVDTITQSGVVFYRLKQIDLDGTIHLTDPVQINTVTGVNEKFVPTRFSLAQNYPNPFNPSTTITYDLSKDAKVTLTMYNLLGQEVATLVNEQLRAGRYSLQWNAQGLVTGVYFYRLQAGSYVETRKLVLLR